MKKQIENIQDKTFTLLTETGTNWSVDRLPLQTADGRITDAYGLFRSGNKKYLASVGGVYTVMPNAVLAETIVEAANRLGLDSFRGGELKGGRKVYYQVALTDAHIGSDTLKRHITALNSHDRSSSIGFGSSNTCVICENTFYMAHKEVDKFRHTASAEDRIKLAMNQITTVQKADTILMENFKRMTYKKIEKPLFERLVKELFDVDLNTTKKDLSGRKANQIEAFSQAVEKETNRHGGKTLWSLFNAVTYYTNHVETLDSKGKIKRSAEENVMTGSGRQKNGIAFDVIMNWIDERTHEPVLITK